MQSSQRGMERRIVAQLFDSIDYISSLGNSSGGAKLGDGEAADGASEGDTTEKDPSGADGKGKQSKLVVLIAATNK
jgi:hypothetical protein